MTDNGYKEKLIYFDSQVSAPWSGTAYGEDEKKKLDRLFKHIGSLKGMIILEPGCGTGRLTEILSDRVGSEGRIVALDISPKMIEAARKRLNGRSNVEVHLAAIETFPLKREQFDLIVCHQVFPHFEDKQAVLKILAGALKSGQRLIVIHFIDFDRINDRHRKAGTAVEHDMMPSREEMGRFFNGAGLTVESLLNDDLGYFLSSSK